MKLILRFKDWDTRNILYFTVTSYKIGLWDSDISHCEGYRYNQTILYSLIRKYSNCVVSILIGGTVTQMWRTVLSFVSTTTSLVMDFLIVHILRFPILMKIVTIM